MKPVYQEIVDPGKGDCFSACLASILELPLADVPKFMRDHGRDMQEAARNWLADNFGLSLVLIQLENREGDWQSSDMRLVSAVTGTPCILTFPSPNFKNTYHAVVGETDKHGINFTVVHDPNRDGKPVSGHPRYAEFLVPINPSVFIKQRRNSNVTT